MINNISKTKGTLRIVIGLTLLILFVAHILNGMLGLTMFSLSGVLLISGLFRSCPLTFLVNKIRTKE